MLPNQEYDFDLEGRFAEGSHTVKGLWPVTAACQWFDVQLCLAREILIQFVWCVLHGDSCARVL